MDEENIRWLAEQFRCFPRRASDASLVLLPKRKECIAGEDLETEISQFSEMSKPFLANFIVNDGKGSEDEGASSTLSEAGEFQTWSKKDQSHQENRSSEKPQRQRKVSSCPSDLFDCESLMEKVDSLRSVSISSSGSSYWADDRIADLENTCDDLRAEVKMLKKANKELLDSKLIIQQEAAQTTEDFQNTIDQLVTEVVNLESEIQEARIMLSDVWEKSQVAHEAAKHRRKRINGLKRGHYKEVKILKARLKKLQEKESIDDEIMSRIQKSGRVSLTFANTMGQSYISPLKKNQHGIENGKAKDMLATPRASGVLLKPKSDANENCLRKLAAGGFEDTKTIRLTVEKMSPAKEPSMITSLEIGESNAEISDLIARIQSVKEQQILYANSVLEDNELTGIGEQVKVMPSFFDFNKFRPQEEERSTRSRTRQGVHKRRRSFSAPPNKQVYVSLLKAIARSNISEDKKRETTRFSHLIQDEATTKLSLITKSRKRSATADKLILSPKRSYGPVPKIGATMNTLNISHRDKVIFEYPDEEQLREDRGFNEWKDQSIDGLNLDSLEQDLGNSFGKSMDLRLDPQGSISIPPVDKKRGYGRKACSRKSRSRSNTQKRRRKRSEGYSSFTLVV